MKWPVHKHNQERSDLNRFGSRVELLPEWTFCSYHLANLVYCPVYLQTLLPC
jgi:hypothetical protein